jgi:hypothetical protein
MEVSVYPTWVADAPPDGVGAHIVKRITVVRESKAVGEE